MPFANIHHPNLPFNATNHCSPLAKSLRCAISSSKIAQCTIRSLHRSWAIFRVSSNTCKSVGHNLPSSPTSPNSIASASTSAYLSMSLDYSSSNNCNIISKRLFSSRILSTNPPLCSILINILCSTAHTSVDATMFSWSQYSYSFRRTCNST